MDDQLHIVTVHESVSDWLKSPKTWIAGAALLFTLGGSVTVFRQTLASNDLMLKETHRVMLDHQESSNKMTEVSKASIEQSQRLLQEIVRVSKVNCLNTAKDDLSRRSCLGIEHQ